MCVGFFQPKKRKDFVPSSSWTGDDSEGKLDSYSFSPSQVISTSSSLYWAPGGFARTITVYAQGYSSGLKQKGKS